MCDPKKTNEKEHRFRYRPFMRPHRHPIMERPFMFGMYERHPLKAIINEMESKEEAIEFLEIQIKRLNKHKKYLTKRMARLDEIEKSIEETIGEVGQLKEFSKDEMKTILKKKYREFANKMLDEW